MVRSGARWAFTLPTLLALVICMNVTAGELLAAEGERPRISVEPVAGDQAPPDLRERVRQSVTEGLLASGAEVAQENPAYALRAKLEVDGRSYALRLEMVDVKTGQVVASREDRCEICTESEAFETASTAASALKAQVLKRSPGPLRTAGPVPAAPPPAAATGTVPALTTVPDPREAPGPNRVLGWGAIGAGALAAGAGAFLISIDGDYVSCGNPPGAACPDLRDTGWGGVALVSAGVVAVGLGLLVLLGKI